MPRRLTRSGDSFALVIDRPLLEAPEIDGDSELELSTGDLYSLVDGVAVGEVDEAEASAFLGRHGVTR